MSDDPKRDALGALHEVSNALTVLLGWVAEARDPAATPDEVGHALRIVEQRGRMARDLARRAIGAKVPRSMDADADVGTVITEVVDALALEAQRAQVRIARSDDALAATCRVPLGEDLEQIVTNLALNAFAHAPKGTELRIVTHVAPREITIDVAPFRSSRATRPVRVVQASASVTPAQSPALPEAISLWSTLVATAPPLRLQALSFA